jgi:hypothetical protein
MAKFVGTRTDNRKRGSIGRTMKGTGQLGAKGTWERQLEAKRQAGPAWARNYKGPVERALEQGRTFGSGGD